MGPDPKILDDIARVAGGAVNIVTGFQTQIRDEIKSRIEEMADRMDLVPREDVDRLEGMITKLRAEQKDLAARLTKMEGKKAPTKKTVKKKAAKKAISKTTKKKPAKKAATKKAKKKTGKKK